MFKDWENGCRRCPTNHYTLRCVRAGIGHSKASTTKGNSPNVQHKHEIQQIDSNTHPIHQWHVISTIASIIQLHKQHMTQKRPSASSLQHYETYSSPFLQENQGYRSFASCMCSSAPGQPQSGLKHKAHPYLIISRAFITLLSIHSLFSVPVYRFCCQEIRLLTR